MVDITVPCETIARLSKIITRKDEPWFNTFRVEAGSVIVSNRQLIVVEHVAKPATGPTFHITAHDALIAQCVTEAAWGSLLTLTVTPELRYTVAKTTLGYIFPGNAGCWIGDPNPMDDWRSVVDKCRKPAVRAVGGMMWDDHTISLMTQSSPSGMVVFESTIDATRPAMMRDLHDERWRGFFSSSHEGAVMEPAVWPEWLK